MPHYTVKIERSYVVRESTDIEIEADTEEGAMARAAEMHAAGDFADDWQQHGGGFIDPDSVSYSVTPITEAE